MLYFLHQQFIITSVCSHGKMGETIPGNCRGKKNLECGERYGLKDSVLKVTD